MRVESAGSPSAHNTATLNTPARSSNATPSPRTVNAPPRDLVDLGESIMHAAQNFSKDQGQGLGETLKNLISWLLSKVDANSPTSGAESPSGVNNAGSGLAQKLPQGGEVSEEQLYAAVLQQQIQKRSGDAAADAFAKEFEGQKKASRRSDGYIPIEDAARNALRTLTDRGVLDKATAEQINGEAFRAAQLDDNGTVLYDDRGGPNDATRATASADVALERALRQLARFRSGLDQADPRPLESASTIQPKGGRIDGSGGFVFKPESESNGKLVILVPKEHAREVTSLKLKDSSGNVVSGGRSHGYANGGREHFRFDQPGGRFPKNLTVELTLRDGSTIDYQIPDPSKRYD